MSALSSFFTAPGTAAATSAAKKNANVKGKYSQLFGGAMEDYEVLHKLFSGDNAMAGFRTALNALNQSPQQQTQQFANGANEAAATQANQTANFLRSQGFGDGLIAGAGNGAYQQAATQTNQFAAQQMDPQQQLQRLLAFLQAQQGAEGGALNALQQFGSGVYGAPAVAAPESPLMGILGAFTGNYASALGSKAGGKK